MSYVELAYGAAVAIAGAVADTAVQQSALQKQYNAQAANIAEQTQLNNKANAVNQNTINQINNNLSQQTQQTAQQQTAAYKAALAQQAAQVPNTVGNDPGASAKYKALAAQTDATDTQFGNTEAGIYGQATAPEMTELANQRALMSGESQLGLLEGQSQQQNYLSQLATAGITANPWLEGLGSAAQGVGEGMMGSAIYGATMAPGATADATGTGVTPAGAGNPMQTIDPATLNYMNSGASTGLMGPKPVVAGGGPFG